MDDMWSIDAWHAVRMFLPNNFNGSRILITTRQFDVAVGSGCSNPHQMDFLNEDKSSNLFCATIFPQECFPLELEKVGKKIARRCKGLPLALVVIGGLLAKSKTSSEYWECVAENLTSIINLESDEQCLKMLSLSYNHLPIHLKQCFLYMANFPEDCEISASRLIKLWVAEGLLKPTRVKSLEEVAMEYLRDLIDRNLIIVRKRGKTTRKIKSCIMHDLLRDLCLREAQKENFLYVCNVEIPPGPESVRRLCIHPRVMERNYCSQLHDALQSASIACSLVCEFKAISRLLASTSKLLRVLDVVDEYSHEEIMQLVNSRYLAFYCMHGSPYLTGHVLNSSFPSSISLLWNLQTIIVHGYWLGVLPSEIWEMTQRRHLQFPEVVVADPPQSHIGAENPYILANLQTLYTVKDLGSTEEFLKRISNLKKMKINYWSGFNSEWLHNLKHLHKLETLSLLLPCPTMYYANIASRRIAFPFSLKKLTISDCLFDWEYITIVGSLPNLEVLKLVNRAFLGPKWNAIEGEFVRLKFLLISETDLKFWRADSIHFPSLEQLVIGHTDLVELPSGLAELPMLRFIQLKYCKQSLIASAKQILEERENLGYEGLQIHVCAWNGEYFLG